MESWFTLQHIAPETPPGDPTADINSTCLEYVLNFLGNAGHKKFDRWKPTGSDAEKEKEKEQNVQYRLIRALNDKELVKKLLALDLTATTA